MITSTQVDGMKHADHRCGADCCHWAEPLAMPDVLTIERVQIKLSYEQWIVYHWHVVQHQGGLQVDHSNVLILT